MGPWPSQAQMGYSQRRHGETPQEQAHSRGWPGWASPAPGLAGLAGPWAPGPWALDLGVGPFGPTPDAHMDPLMGHPIQRARA